MKRGHDSNGTLTFTDPPRLGPAELAKLLEAHQSRGGNLLMDRKDAGTFILRGLDTEGAEMFALEMDALMVKTALEAKLPTPKCSHARPHKCRPSKCWVCMWERSRKRA